MTVWLMHIACWITKATNTHSEYVILIAFLLQKRLRERASVLRFTYIVRFVNVYKNGLYLCGISGFHRAVGSVLFWDVMQLTLVVQVLSRPRLGLLDP